MADDKLGILLAFITFISLFMSNVCASTDCKDPCFSSPSNTCVVDEVGNVLHYCAVGCEKDPGPPGAAYCVHGPFDCVLYFGLGNYACKDGSTPSVRCASAQWVAQPDLSDCILECATACGRRTQLIDNCEECTISDICSIYPANSNMEEACAHTCYGVCESNKQFCIVIELIRYGAMFLGIIMLILSGLKWLVSEDLESRRDARRGIEYIIAGFIVVVAASALVEAVFLHTIRC